MDKRKIEEGHLDELMNNLFLEEHAAAFQEEAADFILQQDYALEINANKEKQLIRKLNRKLKGPGGYGKYVGLLAIVTFGIVAYLFTESGNKKMEGTKSIPTNNLNSTESKREMPAAKTAEGVKPDDIIANQEFFPAKESGINSKKRSNGASVYYPISGVGSKSVSTFFKPTDQDFVFYQKEKRSLLESMLHIDKGLYSVVEGEKMRFGNKVLEVPPFILRDHLITNLEYKIFLAELIQEDNVELFEKATVRNEVWLDYNDNILATTYFFEKRYDNFPVVNISPEAANLFCNWLEKEINEFSKQINAQTVPMNVRLPFQVEMLLALKKGYQQAPDCNGYQAIYETKDGVADFTPRKNENGTNVLDSFFSVNRCGMDENKILQLFDKGFTYTSKLTNKSELEIFGKVAHVSEMIEEQGSNKIKIAGSCWKNKKEYHNMVNAFNKAKASPFVGFRVAIIYPVK